MIMATMMIRLFLSVILCRAALHKLRDIKTFQAELAAYQLLPTLLLPITTVLLITAETFTSIALLNKEWIFPVFIAAVLFLIYALAMVINLVKGRTDIDCGCSGPVFSHKEGKRKTISWFLVIRNLILISLALACITPIITARAITESLGSVELFIILAGAITLWLLYETIEQAMANAQEQQRWKVKHSWIR